jgi:hypothetical protein
MALTGECIAVKPVQAQRGGSRLSSPEPQANEYSSIEPGGAPPLLGTPEQWSNGGTVEQKHVAYQL